MAYIKVLGSGFIKLTRSYGSSTSTAEWLAANAAIDATSASWTVSSSANRPDAGTSSLERD